MSELTDILFERDGAIVIIEIILKPRVTQRIVAAGRLSDLRHSRVVQRRLEQRSIRLAPFPWVSTEI
jgi:hypothetical protein